MRCRVVEFQSLVQNVTGDCAVKGVSVHEVWIINISTQGSNYSSLLQKSPAKEPCKRDDTRDCAVNGVFVYEVLIIILHLNLLYKLTFKKFKCDRVVTCELKACQFRV